jgi:hypothetical protein
MGCGNRHDSPSHCLQQLEPERVLSELRLTLQRAGLKQAGRAAASRSAAGVQRLA